MGDGEGVGEGDATGVGVGDGLGVGLGVGLGDTLGDGDGLGEGEAAGVEVGSSVKAGVGEGLGVDPREPNQKAAPPMAARMMAAITIQIALPPVFSDLLSAGGIMGLGEEFCSAVVPVSSIASEMRYIS